MYYVRADVGIVFNEWNISVSVVRRQNNVPKLASAAMKTTAIAWNIAPSADEDLQKSWYQLT